MATREHTVSAGTAAEWPSGMSYVEWGPLFAGAVLAGAISAVLLQFGGTIGLSAASPGLGDSGPTTWGVIAAGIWIFWVQLMSVMAGGYLAGRMRQPWAGAGEHEREMRDGMHGLLVWALGTVAVVVATGAATALAAGAADGAGAAGPAAQAQADEAARQLAEMTRHAGVVFGFITAAGSLVSAVAAWWMATLGGDHRDDAVDFSRHVSFRRRTL